MGLTGSDGSGTPAGAGPEKALPEPADAGPREPGEAVVAGGCFWCVEAVFEPIAGVTSAVSGYAGGSAETANYPDVCTGATGHAEVVRIAFDPDRVAYGQILRLFFAAHDPTQINRQGPDVGPQYRSAIFYANDAQKRAAERYIEQLTASGLFPAPIATTLEPLEAFHPAEEKHQDFVRRNAGTAYVEGHARPKIERIMATYPSLVASSVQ